MILLTLMLIAAGLQGSAVQAAGPVAPPAAAGSTLRSADLRIASVGLRLAVAGSRFCPEPYPATGFLLHHLAEYDSAGRRTQIARYGLDRGPGILAVVEGSPAAGAGLRAGDILLAVNGLPFAVPQSILAEQNAERRRILMEAEAGRIESALRQGPARLRLLRGGEILEVELDSVSACPVRIRLAYSNQPTAFSSRGYVILTTRVLQLIRSDDELAVVIGHELGHHVLEHEQRLDAQKVPKGWLRGVGKNAGRIRSVEEEADRFGLRIAAAAEYDIRATAGMWDRLAKAGWRGPQLFRTHPTVAARKRMIEQVAAEGR